jgi:hypothetical protein
MIADHDEVVGLVDCMALAVDERLSGEIVDVMHRPDDLQGRACIPDAARSSGCDAVLGMQNRELVDEWEHAVFEGADVWGSGDDGLRHLGGPKETDVGIAQRNDVYRFAGSL